MRRELKLVILVLVLIVGPSATLSFLAGRVLGNWQIVLRGRMSGEAERVLDAVASAWVADLDGLREQMVVRLMPHLAPRSIFFQATRGVAEIKARHQWISDVFVVQEGRGLLYPIALTNTTDGMGVPGLKESASYFSLRQADQQARASTNSEAAIAAYRRLLDVPKLDPVVNSMALLRLAQAYQAANQPDRALENLQVCEGLSGQHSTRQGAPLRDPEEGFFLDLIALGDMADLHAVSGRLDMAGTVRREMGRRMMERFDILPTLQRQFLVVLMGGQGWAGMVSDEIQWRECLRAYMMVASEKERIERDFAGISRGLTDEGWQWLRFGTNDYLVTQADREAHGGEGVVVRFDRQRLADAVTRLSRQEGRQTGIRVACGLQDSNRKLGRDSLTLAERRLAPPLDRFVMTATPVDPLAFAANAMLQKRLYGMAGGLLMLGVIVGGLLMWREAAWEIHKAREHSDFAAAVSHDLRTPLSSMRMLAESLYLERVQEADKRRKFLGAILKESDRLSRLTDRALYFIRYGEGMLRYRFTEGDLGGIVQEAVETFATGIGASVIRWPPVVEQREGDMEESVNLFPLVENGAIETNRKDGVKGGWILQLHIEPGLEPVWFDAGAIEQVVFNLLDNAVKYSGREHVIEVEVRRHEGPPPPDPGLTGLLGRWLCQARHRVYVEIAVRDHGAGMNKEEVKRIVRPYIRGSRGMAANKKGIGLGLALCKHVIRAHKGGLDIQSVEGKGSTFRVILPAGEV